MIPGATPTTCVLGGQAAGHLCPLTPEHRRTEVAPGSQRVPGGHLPFWPVTWLTTTPPRRSSRPFCAEHGIAGPSGWSERRGGPGDLDACAWGLPVRPLASPARWSRCRASWATPSGPNPEALHLGLPRRPARPSPCSRSLSSETMSLHPLSCCRGGLRTPACSTCRSARSALPRLLGTPYSRST